MNAVVRTILRLDERSETKEVAGHRIDSNIPVPPKTVRFSKVRKVMAALQVGESFQREDISKVYQYARELGIEVTCRQQGGMWRIWRKA